jgi:membrane-associated phospholipid phosphatase
MQLRKIYLLALSALCTSAVYSQDSTMVVRTPQIGTAGPVYKIKNIIDIPVTAATVAYSIYGMGVIYGRDAVPVSEVLALKKSDINKFDRPIADNYDLKAKALSDKFFYGSMPAPLLLLLDKKIRKDGLKIGLFFLEAMGTTGTIYTTAAMSANRFRPYAYNPNVDIATRTRGGARNSFYAGHPSVVATSTFFMAKVFNDYHPEMRNKWILFAVAGAATATTGYLRLKAGQHFKTDVLTGITLGTLSGILIPQIHKNKDLSKNVLSVYPNFQGDASGLTAIYHFNRREHRN